MLNYASFLFQKSKISDTSFRNRNEKLQSERLEAVDQWMRLHYRPGLALVTGFLWLSVTRPHTPFTQTQPHHAGLTGPIGRLSSLYRGEPAAEIRRWRPLPALPGPVGELLQATRTITRSGIEVMHSAHPCTGDQTRDLLLVFLRAVAFLAL